jgi:hypothetical protein
MPLDSCLPRVIPALDNESSPASTRAKSQGFQQRIQTGRRLNPTISIPPAPAQQESAQPRSKPEEAGPLRWHPQTFTTGEVNQAGAGRLLAAAVSTTAESSDASPTDSSGSERRGGSRSARTFDAVPRRRRQPRRSPVKAVLKNWRGRAQAVVLFRIPTRSRTAQRARRWLVSSVP